MGWIGGGVGGLVDAERGGFETPALDQRPAGAVGGIGLGQVRQVVVVNVDPAQRQAAEGPAAGQDDVQERGGVVGVGEPAGQAHDGDRCSGRISHGTVPG